MSDENQRLSTPSISLSRISVFRYVFHYPGWPLFWALLIAGSVIPVWLVSFWFLLLLVPALLSPVFYWIHIKERFKYGMAKPGVVVNVNPTLIAVWTDLSKGLDSYPAVKVVRAPLRRAMGRPVSLGTRVPTVGVYQGLPQIASSTWWDFDLRPLECATADRDTLDRVTADFMPQEWERLEEAIQGLPTTQPGLYRLTKAGWKSFGGFSFVAAFRASLGKDLPLSAIDQPHLRSGLSWLRRARDQMTFPRFTIVTGAVTLLCAFGAISLAMYLGFLWRITGPMTPAMWRSRFVLVGIAAMELFLGMVIGAVYIRHKYSDRRERATKQLQFLLAVAGFALGLIAEEFARWAVSAPEWLHPLTMFIVGIGLVAFAKTVHSVLLRIKVD